MNGKEPTREDGEKAFLALFQFTKGILERLREMETDLDVPAKYSTWAKTVRWDWESKNKQ